MRYLRLRLKRAAVAAEVVEVYQDDAAELQHWPL